MSMKLDKDKIVPALVANKALKANENVYSMLVDGVKCGVDFKKNEIFWMDDADRSTTDCPELSKFKAICLGAMFPHGGELSNDAPESAANRSVEGEQVEEESTIPEYEPPRKESFASSTKQVSVLPPLSTVDIVRPAISALAAKQAWQEYLEMRKVILERSDFQHIQGKDFIKKSGWRKFATFYNLTDKIVEENRIADSINGTGAFIWKIKVICTAPNGRQTEGVAMCSSKEKSGPRVEHDVYSTAHTRAKNRAISDMIAAGEVSAEEMDV